MEPENSVITKKERASRILPVQKQFIIQFLEENRTMVTKKFTSTCTFESVQNLWKKLAVELNKLGPAKTPEGWQKSWKDMKCSAKKAASEVAKEKRGTGGGPVKLGDLSLNKERIVALNGGLLSATGDKNVNEFGRIFPMIKKPYPTTYDDKFAEEFHKEEFTLQSTSPQTSVQNNPPSTIIETAQCNIPAAEQISTPKLKKLCERKMGTGQAIYTPSAGKRKGYPSTSQDKYSGHSTVESSPVTAASTNPHSFINESVECNIAVIEPGSTCNSQKIVSGQSVCSPPLEKKKEDRLPPLDIFRQQLEIKEKKLEIQQKQLEMQQKQLQLQEESLEVWRQLVVATNSVANKLQGLKEVMKASNGVSVEEISLDDF